jgi:ubiquinone/menaquinone biosynthesis C-methylase UbiE
MDIDAEVIRHAAEKYRQPNLRFVQADCASLPLESGSVDVVVCFETIEHHDQHEAMLREIRRVLRPGGLLVISSPNRPVYDETLAEPNPFHVKELDEAEFLELLHAHFSQVALYGQRVVQGSVVTPWRFAAPGLRSVSPRERMKD